MEQIASNKSFGGYQKRFSHQSAVLNCTMTFSIYLPKQIETVGKHVKFPVLTFLAGLTCSDENFVQKAGAQRLASELGIIIVTPDTSPRGEAVPDDPDGAYDFGLGAGFYLDATEAPWQDNYAMYSYITQELRALVAENFPVDDSRHALCGHSMGGHGALSIALKNPTKYSSVSAFAPIVSPMNCPWGNKALANYLGADTAAWAQYDSVELLKAATDHVPMLVDQGSEDQFLVNELKPELLIEAANKCGYPLDYKIRDGYDHSYFFIASFIEEHLRFHAPFLGIEEA
ncbi:MAG: S-formylglutathione hydrolase [Pseudohongiellaceae bacterium]